MFKKKRVKLPKFPTIKAVNPDKVTGIHVVVPPYPERIQAIHELARMGVLLAQALFTCTHVEITNNYITGADCGIKIDLDDK